MWKYESLPMRFGVQNCSAASTTAAPAKAAHGIAPFIAGADASMNQVAEALPPHPAVVAVPGPIDDEGLPLDVIDRHEAPESTVVAAVAIVPHDEYRVGWNGDRAIVVARREPAVVAGPVDEVPEGVVHL